MKREYKNIQDMTKMSKLFLEIWKLLEKEKFITKEDVFKFCDSLNIDKQLWRRAFLQLIKSNELKEVYKDIYISSYENKFFNNEDIKKIASKIRKDSRLTWAKRLLEFNDFTKNWIYWDFVFLTLWENLNVSIEWEYSEEFTIKFVNLWEELYEQWYDYSDFWYRKEKAFLDYVSFWDHYNNDEFRDVYLSNDEIKFIDNLIESWFLNNYESFSNIEKIKREYELTKSLFDKI